MADASQPWLNDPIVSQPAPAAQAAQPWLYDPVVSQPPPRQSLPAAAPGASSSGADIDIVGPATIERWRTNPPQPPAPSLTGYAAQDAQQDYAAYLNWRAQQARPNGGQSAIPFVAPPAPTVTNGVPVVSGSAGAPQSPARGLPLPPAPLPASTPQAASGPFPLPPAQSQVAVPAPGQPPPLAMPAPPQVSPSAPPGAPLIGPPQQGAPSTGPSLIAPAAAAPSSPPAPTPGPLQGLSDAAFATLDQIPGLNQAGAATNAALGYMFGEGSQAATFGQRYQENLAANLARLNAIPAALRVPAGVIGNVGAAIAGGNVLGAGASVAANAVPAVGSIVNALSDLPALVRYMGVGAAQGGLQGASDAPTNVDIVPDALQGAGIGAAAGAALPAIGKAVAAPIQAAGRYVSPFIGRVNALSDITGDPIMGQTNRWNGQPIMATEAQMRMAGQQIVQAADDPDAVRASLAGGPVEIVPGSTPTTFQQTGDIGLGGLERAVATRDRGTFNKVSANQNAARLASLHGLRSDGDPMDVVNTVRARRAAIDQTAQQNLDQLTAARDARSNAIGPDYDPEAQGNDMREPILANEEAAVAHERALHAAVDPDGTLAVNATPVRQAARQILSEQTPSARPLSSAENQMFNVAAAYKPVVSYREMAQLSENLNSALREELAIKGRTPSYARLSRFRAAVESAMDGSVERQATDEAQAVAAGTMSPEETIAARINEDVANWRAKREQQNVSRGGAASDVGKRATSRRVGGVSGLGTGRSEGSWRPGTAASDPRLAPEQADLTEDWDEAAQQRRLTANAATKERVATFNKGPVGRITQRADASDQLRVSDAQVPTAILRRGPTGLEALQAYKKAGGSLDAARDALAMQARHVAVNADGSLNASKLSGFRQGYARVLSDPSMEPLNDALGNAEGAQRVLSEAAARAKAAKVAEDASAASRFLGAASPQDVSKQVGTMFGSRNSTAVFTQLRQQIGQNQAAIDGVRRAIIEHMETRLVSNTEAATSGQNKIAANAFQTFMRQNRSALRQFFSENEVNTMELLGKDIQQSLRSRDAIRLAGESNTAGDIADERKFTLASRLGKAIVVQALSGGTLGILGGESGALTGEVIGVSAAVARDVIASMRLAGLKTVDDLVTEAMLHPEIARILIAKVTPETAPRILRALSHAVTRAAAVNFTRQAVTTGYDDPSSQKPAPNYGIPLNALSDIGAGR